MISNHQSTYQKKSSTSHAVWQTLQFHAYERERCFNITMFWVFICLDKLRIFLHSFPHMDAPISCRHLHFLKNSQISLHLNFLPLRPTFLPSFWLTRSEWIGAADCSTQLLRLLSFDPTDERNGMEDSTWCWAISYVYFVWFFSNIWLFFLLQLCHTFTFQQWKLSTVSWVTESAARQSCPCGWRQNRYLSEAPNTGNGFDLRKGGGKVGQQSVFVRPRLTTAEKSLYPFSALLLLPDSFDPAYLSPDRPPGQVRRINVNWTYFQSLCDL